MSKEPLINPAKIGKTSREPVHCEPIPHWGGVVHMRILSAMEHIDLETSRGEASGYVRKLLSYVLCDAKGNDVPEIVAAICQAETSEKPTIEKLASLAMEINDIGNEANVDREKN